MRRTLFRKSTMAAIGAALVAFTALASEAAARGLYALHVQGEGVRQELRLELADLEALGARTITTETMWTEGATEFRGVPLAAILAAAGAHGSDVRATALNDYAVDFPVADALAWEALVAFEADGSTMSVRDKGPFWIVFPWTERPELKNGNVQAVSVWQLVRLEVR